MTEDPTSPEQDPKQDPRAVYVLKILVRDDPDKPDSRLVTPVGEFETEAAAGQQFHALRAQDPRVDGYQILIRTVSELNDEETPSK